MQKIQMPCSATDTRRTAITTLVRARARTAPIGAIGINRRNVLDCGKKTASR